MPRAAEGSLCCCFRWRCLRLPTYMLWSSSFATSTTRLLTRLPNDPAIAAWRSKETIRRLSNHIDSRPTSVSPGAYYLPSNGTTPTRLGLPLPSLRGLRTPKYLFRPPSLIVRTCFNHANMSGGPAVIEGSKPRDEYRLPTDVKPKHYDVTLRTDLEKSRFDGYVVAQYVHVFLSRSSKY